MGGPKQVNSGQASAANAGASSVGTTALGQSGKEFGNAQGIMDMFFGKTPGSGPGGTGGGTLSSFLDPKSLNTTELNPTYKAGYDANSGIIQQNADNSMRNIVQQSANRGLGLSSAATADLQRKNALDTGNERGQAFASALSQQHQEALNNFWGATGTAATAAGQQSQVAQGNNSTAGNTYSNIYGTAGRESSTSISPGQIIGSGLQAGGAVGAAAFCPAEGSIILTPEGEVPIETLKCGDVICQLGGTTARLKCDPIKHENVPIVSIDTNNGLGGEVSESHTFARADGGYGFAVDVKGQFLKTECGNSLVDEVKKVGIGTVYRIVTEDGGLSNRTYCADGVWSLE